MQYNKETIKTQTDIKSEDGKRRQVDKYLGSKMKGDNQFTLGHARIDRSVENPRRDTSKHCIFLVIKKQDNKITQMASRRSDVV